MKDPANGQIYCFDTSSLIWAMRTAYPLDVLPPFWEKMSDAASAGLIISPEAVKDEIGARDDDLLKWTKESKFPFAPMDGAQATNMKTVMSKCGPLIDPTRKKDEADPYVVALALAKSAVIVTQENTLGPSSPRMKIPDACKVMGLQSINLLSFIREMKWVFR
ncbi:MAG: DUF4411 family protein [Bdellovibrionales bacterium]|nr:DUF4411 family protein [Bdellovibrionales bacterium]